MKSTPGSLLKHLRRMGPAYLVLAIALVPVMIAYHRVKESVLGRDRERFEQVVQTTQEALIQRMENYVSALRGLRGLFDARKAVDLEEWKKYARSIEIKYNYRGMMDIGFAQRVLPEEKERHVAAMRAKGFADYSIQPPGERDEYFPLIYLTTTTNASEWVPGWDPFSEPNRRAAMVGALRADNPIATGKIALFAPDGSAHEAGFIIYLPLYRDGVKPSKVEDRKAATIGFVFASFRARALGREIFGKQVDSPIDFEVFDSATPSAEGLLYDSDGVLAAGNPSVSRYLSRMIEIPGMGRTWGLHCSTLSAFELDSKKHLPPVVLGGGLMVSCLLFGVAWTQARARSAAERLTGELRQSEESLEEEKERLAVTLRSIGEGVITSDTEGRVDLLNKAAESLTGWMQTEARGKPLLEVFQLLYEQTRERCDNPVERVLKTDAPFNQGMPAVLVSRQGAERFVVTSSAPIHDQAGHVVGVVVAFRDVTETRKLESELNKAGKLESLGLLAGGIAHEFNNILTGIFGNISLAKMLAADDGSVQERLEKAELACQRAKEMTGQLLTFARGGAPIKRARPVAQMLKEFCDLAVLGSNVRCDYSLTADLWPVDVDQGQIGQAFNNILLNAVQAMPGGGTITVRAENLPAGGRSEAAFSGRDFVRISIQDQGTGIPPEHLSRIFDPFFSTKFKGRGLGLATAYSIIRKHEGFIEVDSRPEQGAIFHVYLPASARSVSSTATEVAKPMTGQGRVLVMDDEPEILNFAQAALKRLGYEAELARDGAEAIRRYTAATESGNPFAAVIMDLTIPGGMGGQEAIKRLLDIDPQVRAIVSSGYSNDPVMADFQKHGFRGVVAKPYEVKELARVLREVISSDTGS
jgi:PAS domain S-box-containing protein